MPNRFIEDNYNHLFNLECEARNATLRKLFRKIYRNYEENKKKYEADLQQFMIKYCNRIDKLRARLMLSMDAEKLQQILFYERNFQDETDHLPLKALKKKFAMIMENGPQKVSFK